MIKFFERGDKEHLKNVLEYVYDCQNVEKMKEEWRLVRELGEVQINGKKGVQLQCYFGSHTYTQAEMSRLLHGIVNECHDLGVPTPEDNELESKIKKVYEEMGNGCICQVKQ